MTASRLLLAATLATTLAAGVPAEAAPDTAARQRLAKTLLTEWAAGDVVHVRALFSPRVQALILPAQLKAAWQQFEQRFGRFQAITGMRSGQGDDLIVTCRFENATQDLLVRFDRDGHVFAVQGAGPAATYAPPSYADPGSFTEREVVVGPLDLPGTITMPKGKGPFPALVLVHGSGPNDRDESIGPNKPFKDLAWGLASRGVAVLRYDKRTKARPAECVRLGDRFTVQEEVIEDARAAVRLLAHTPGVDATRVFLLGHSLGGYLAPRIAEGAPELAGLVIMAGPVRPFEDLLVDQARYLGQVDGMPRDVLDQQVRDIQRRATRVKAPDLSPLTASASLPLGIPAPYWLDLRQVHPPQTARALGKPILVLQGERDYQVTTADFELWKQGLEGASVASYRLYPALNHLFQPGTGLCKPAEYQVPGHVLPEVVTDVAGWIRGGDAR